MKFESAFNCGDKGWTFNGNHVRELTIGQVRVEYTQSAGIGDGYMEGGIASYSGGNSGQVADNYAPMEPVMVEMYMCVETGIGSGNVYTLGEHIFTTKAACEKACAVAIAARQKEKEEAARWREEEDRRRLASVRLELASLEKRLGVVPA